MRIIDVARMIKRWINEIYLHKEKVNLGLDFSTIPYLTKLKYNILGFTAEEYYLYDLKNNDYRDYISYWERLGLENVNNEKIASILSEKEMFERIFGRFVRVPHMFAYIIHGRYIDTDTGKEVDIISILKEKGKLIAKPTNSPGGGKGIHSLEYVDDRFYLDFEYIEHAELLEKLKTYERYIIVESISSAKYSKEIYSRSANSIRIITAMNEEKSDADILLAAHRFGTERSKYVDNIASGGVFALVDEDTGRIGKAKCILFPNESFSVHPDTGAKIEGIYIPDFKSIVDELLRVHKCFPYYDFFAWDVVLDETNKPVILEINRGSGLEFQTIKPLRDEKIGKYMRSKKLLKF